MSSEPSVFHKGELAVQQRAGVADSWREMAARMVRDHMPDQHREFFSQLPMLFAGHVDRSGDIWASMLTAASDTVEKNKSLSFVVSPDNKTLVLDSAPVFGDPLVEFLADSQNYPSAGVDSGARIGLLGIELSSRRRNRLNAELKSMASDGGKLTLGVVQSFGNCPQYIQTRHLEPIEPSKKSPSSVENFDHLDQDLQHFIRRSDTFFVASSTRVYGKEVDSAGTEIESSSEGADISHRGGKPGFVRVDNASTLTIPDYSGNSLFNTLGNFEVNPHAGLLFIDFELGHILTLTGSVEILWDSPDQQYFTGAERLWQFTLKKGRLLKHALPFTWRFDEYSPNSLLTGSWDEVKSSEAAQLTDGVKNDIVGHMKSEDSLSKDEVCENPKDTWLDYHVVKKIKESEYITSFYLAPDDQESRVNPGKQEPEQEKREKNIRDFKPGQFISVKAQVEGREVARTYTLSSSPYDEKLRISVKRESSTNQLGGSEKRASKCNEGIFSNFLHQAVEVGDTLKIKSPMGDFFLNSEETRPAVLISAGVGITPMVSMARHVLAEGEKTGRMRRLTLISAFRNARQRAFHQELKDISLMSKGEIRIQSVLSQPERELNLGKDFDKLGRISKTYLQDTLPLDDYDFYLCGPSSFMQGTYIVLRNLGIEDHRIYAESFGPAALVRDSDEPQEKVNPVVPPADNAIVEFERSGLEQTWGGNDGNLLDFAESHGLQPDFGCRNGQCGSCKVKILQGHVSHGSNMTAKISKDEALLCCAKPAKVETESENQILRLDL